MSPQSPVSIFLLLYCKWNPVLAILQIKSNQKLNLSPVYTIPFSYENGMEMLNRFGNRYSVNGRPKRNISVPSSYENSRV